MARFCRYCGNPVREGANFCKTCGARIGAQSAPNGAGTFTGRSARSAAYPSQPRTTSSRVGVPAAQAKKKKSPAAGIAAVLVIALLVTGFGWPGWLRTLIRGGGDEAAIQDVGDEAAVQSDRDEAAVQGGGEEAVIHTVEVTLPASTGARAAVEEEAAVAVEAYLVARAYYDKLENYDLENFDPDDYNDLLDRAVTAFEIADELSAALEEDAEYLSELEDEGVTEAGAAVYRELTARPRTINPFTVTAYAADESPSMKWAQDITKIYDKAPVGKGIRTLAAELGTDAKHAYALLTQAQNTIAGDAMAEAEYWNAAYQTAVETKAAASAAGFAVAVAASGGAAAGIASALEVGGVVCSGVQAVLDVGTAVTIATTNGEGNEYTTAFENTSSQFAPISAFFALGNAGVNAYNIYKGVDVGDNKAQAIIYLANSVTDYFTSDGSILGGTLTYNKDGLSFTLMDTLFGTDPKQQEAAKKMLRDLGVDEKTIKEAMDIAAGKAPSTPAPEIAPEPEEEEGYDGGLGDMADQYIEQYDIFTDPNERFDKYGFIEYMRNRVTSSGQDYGDFERPKVIEPGLHVDPDDDSFDEPAEPELTTEPTPEPTPKPTATPKPTSTPKPTPTPKLNGGFEEGITGSYSIYCLDSYTWNSSGNTDAYDYEYTAQVLLHDSGTMEISFANEHIVGTYDPQTRTFVGIGDTVTDDPLATSFFSLYETTLVFETDAGIPIATGGFDYWNSFTTGRVDIIMEKLDG